MNSVRVHEADEAEPDTAGDGREGSEVCGEGGVLFYALMERTI